MSHYSFIFKLFLINFCLIKIVFADPTVPPVASNEFLIAGHDFKIFAGKSGAEITVYQRDDSIKVLTLTSPNRIAVDIPILEQKKFEQSQIDSFKKTLGDSTIIKNFRIGSYSNKIRVVFDLDNSTAFNSEIEKNDSSITIRINNFHSTNSGNHIKNEVVPEIKPTVIATPTVSALPTINVEKTETPVSTPKAEQKPDSELLKSNDIAKLNDNPKTPQPTPETKIEKQELPSDIRSIGFNNEPQFQLLLQLNQKFPFTLTKISDQKYLLQIEGLEKVKESLLLPMYAPKDFPIIESMIIDKDYKIIIYLEKSSALDYGNEIEGMVQKKAVLKAFAKGNDIVVEPLLK